MLEPLEVMYCVLRLLEVAFYGLEAVESLLYAGGSERRPVRARGWKLYSRRPWNVLEVVEGMH